MDDRNWERWGTLGGILFVVLVAITALLPGYPPKTGDSARKIAGFITDNGDEIRWASHNRRLRGDRAVLVAGIGLAVDAAQ